MRDENYKKKQLLLKKHKDLSHYFTIVYVKRKLIKFIIVINHQ